MNILLIDDDLDFLSTTYEWLVKRGDAVHCANNLSTAFLLLRRCDYDLIFLDLVMPDSPGLTSIQRIRALAPDATVAVLSAGLDQRVAKLALQEGADHALIKPANLEKWERIIERLQQRHGDHEALLSQPGPIFSRVRVTAGVNVSLASGQGMGG